jgi:acyl transferase domain-containing protein/acyl-CoA synthetase (AMP-forming)/AMP-acid ligase II/acyl carrier protein
MSVKTDAFSGPVLKPSTLIELLRWRAANQFERPAYTFLVDDESAETTLTYGELHRRASAIGAWLQSVNAAGKTALLVYPPGLEFVAAIFGCFYAGVIAVPAYPPRLNRTVLRLRAIVADAQPAVALTTTSVLSRMEAVFNQFSDLKQIQWLNTDAGVVGLENEWREADVSGETLGFLQYTSGSTGTPKGVMVSHSNVLYNSAYIAHGFEHTAESRALSWLPHFHDMGLIDGIIQPLYSGFCGILMSPTAFLQQPFRWLNAISRYKVTHSGGPNFAYDLCVRKIGPEQKALLDLSRWSVAYNGAEQVRKETLERFSAAFESCGFDRRAFYPAYGLAEATLKVSGGRKSDGPIYCSVEAEALEQNLIREAAHDSQTARTLVGSGRAALDTRILIVNPEAGTLCAEDEVGEIWVSGPGIAGGYWNRTDDTERTFRAYLAGTGEGPFLRTGDMGFLKDGELFIAGRLKDLIIIQGRNLYPHDIERTVEQSHPVLRPDSVAAFSIEAAGEERLVVVQEVDHRKRADWQQVIGDIRQSVAEEHEIQVHAVSLIRLGTIPKTSSGKIQRHACRALYASGALKIVGDWIQPLAEQESQASPPGPTLSQRAHPSRKSATATVIEAWLISRLAELLKVGPESIDIREPFTRHGLNSLAAVSLSGELEVWLERRLSPTLLYEYHNIESLAQHLAGDSDSSPVASGNSASLGSEAEPIAIVGLGCRFPGAEKPEAFWQLLQGGRDAITEVPPERWDLSAFYDPAAATLPGKINTRWGGFLDQVDQFDAHFFSISPREAACIDPQQRLLMEVAWEALENAGQDVECLAGTRTAVFIGISTNDYSRIQLSNPALIDAYAGTGNALSIAANRLSYLFDFRGPSMAVDTACSSSLVAVHLACQSLRKGESTLALAGGVNLILSPALTINFTRAGVMSPDGRCKAFDASANGYVRAEGAGVVILKPLSVALKDGDSIYAVIRGTAVSQDGRTNGLMAPSRQAQEAVLLAAYQDAGISPGQVQYIEAHGTGTLLGDPIEAKALGTVLAQGRTAGSKCAIGSVKTNVGHLEAAAGVAGLIKVALSLKHRIIPPSLHFKEANPHIPFDELPLYVQQTPSPWPSEHGARLAGVSSFGFGGTNAHVVLGEGPVDNPTEAQQREIFSPPQAHLLPLAARSHEALMALAQSYQDFLSTGEAGTDISLETLCYTASVRRSHHDYRLALNVRSLEEAIVSLQTFSAGESVPNISCGRKIPSRQHKLVFVFPGQGGQWFSMGQDLLVQEPVFRQSLERCDRAMREYVDWSLLDQLQASKTESRLNEIDVVQPVLCAIQISLVALWRSWGVEPDAVIGHSMGEVAAAHVAGVLSLEDALKVICRRSRLLKRTSGQGSMAALELSLVEAQEVLAGFEDRLSIAASNSPASTVVSGDPSAIEELIGKLQGQGIFCRQVKVDVASHSPQMEPLREELLQALQGLLPERAAVPMCSTVTGVFGEEQSLDANYWVRNLREPVLFSLGVQRLLESGHHLFVEISPHPILLSAIQQSLQLEGAEGFVLPSLRREEDGKSVMLGTLGTLYTLGYWSDWSKLYARGGRCVNLPSYPWQREHCWIETTPAASTSVRAPILTSGNGSKKNALLDKYMQSAHLSGSHHWEIELDRHALQQLSDRQLQVRSVVPYTAYIKIVLSAASQVFGPGSRVLTEMEFQRPLVLQENETRTLQLVLSSDAKGAPSFHVYSRETDGVQPAAWLLHATGKLSRPAENGGPRHA